MKKDFLSKKKTNCNRRFRHGAVVFMLCLSIVLSSVSFVSNAITQTDAKDSEGTAAVQQTGDSGEKDVKNAEESKEVEKNNDSASSSGAKDSIVLKSKGRYATGAGEYADRLTDRSNDVGVVSEGYEDSPYTISREVAAGTLVNVRVGEETTGGTLFLQKGHLSTTKNYDDDQYWDGKKPFRVTAKAGHEGAPLEFTTYDDTTLEDSVAPYGALKYDNLDLQIITGLGDKDFFARGNKLVMGEGLTTQHNKTWRIYGGTEHKDIFDTDGRPNLVTNVVVASADWDYIYGGGEGPTGRGTQVTIRGTANVDNVYGGGERKGTVGLSDHNQNVLGAGVNVYVEGGTVGTLWGGSAINGKSLFSDSNKIPIYENINVNVSGGHVDRLIAGSDTRDNETNSYSTIGDCYIYGDAIVNITAPNSVGSVAGDPNRNIPRSSTVLRQVQGGTQLNVSASNNFSYFDLFDFVNITGDGENANGVVVTTASKAGETFTDSPLTFWSSGNNGNPPGFIGCIRVADGAKLVLNQGGTINKAYSQYVGGTWTANAYEGNRTLKGSSNNSNFYLSKSWIGESSEARRSLSTLAINGSGAGITAASGTTFSDSADTCGLRIHGNVQGAVPDNMTNYNMSVPGYSTLEVTDTPMYSDANNYYYYVVADSSANGGKAFKEPEGADYIVCYRYLDGGSKIGWYLRERPTMTLTNKLVRAGDTANGNMVMSVNMNGLGYEWSSTAANNSVDFGVTKVTGTTASASTENYRVSLAEVANIKNDTSHFANVVTATDSTSGVEYLVSFDCIYDSSSPVDPSYYTVEADYHVVGDNNYDDVRYGAEADAARCVYDFAGNDNLHANGGYADSVMTTFPYSTAPAGSDTALLRVYLPYDMTGSLNLAENDNSFHFANDTSVNAQLEPYSTVTTNYSTATEAYSNSHFGVTIGGSDLSAGVSKTLSSAVSEYVCTVYSYKNLSIYDISQNTASGLQLNLAVSGLTKGGNAVGTGNPSTVNNGELRIQTAGTYKITFRFNTRTHGSQVFVVKGKLADAAIDSNGQLTDEFILSKAPYESNHGENLNWNAANITRSYTNGVLSAELTANQSTKLVSLNYRLTASGPYSSSIMVPVGSNMENNDNVAAITVDDPTFKYWEIRKSGSSTAPVIARCYDAEFNYCIMDDYWISPVFENASGGSNSARINPDAVKGGNEDWVALTFNEGGSKTVVFPSDDLTFSGLKDKVNFVRLTKGTSYSPSDQSNVLSQTEDIDVQDGKTYVLTSLSGKTMSGEWTDTVTLTHIEYTRNRWTNSEGNLSENGRSDYLYSDFEIAYKDGEAYAICGNDSYRTGAVFEFCGVLSDGDTFTPDSYTFRSDSAALKTAIVNRASSYTTGSSTRPIQCNDISTADLTNMNRVELAKSYFNTPTNSKAIMKVTAYLVDGDNNVTLSNPVYICLKDTSTMNLAFNSN